MLQQILLFVWGNSISICTWGLAYYQVFSVSFISIEYSTSNCRSRLDASRGFHFWTFGTALIWCLYQTSYRILWHSKHWELNNVHNWRIGAGKTVERIGIRFLTSSTFISFLHQSNHWILDRYHEGMVGDCYKNWNVAKFVKAEMRSCSHPSFYFLKSLRICTVSLRWHCNPRKLIHKVDLSPFFFFFPFFSVASLIELSLDFNTNIHFSSLQ